MTTQTKSTIVILAALAALGQAALTIPATAGEGDYSGYQYEAYLAEEARQEALHQAQRPLPARQDARLGTQDLAPAALAPTDWRNIRAVPPRDPNNDGR